MLPLREPGHESLSWLADSRSPERLTEANDAGPTYVDIGDEDIEISDEDEIAPADR